MCVIRHWYHEENFDADHYWGLKDQVPVGLSLSTTYHESGDNTGSRGISWLSPITQSAFYPWSAVRSLRFTLTGFGVPSFLEMRFKVWNCSFERNFWEVCPEKPTASPLMKPFLTPGGWQLEKLVYWNVSVGLKCVFMSNIDSFANLSPL